MLGASLAGKVAVLDGLAMWVFYARIVQSVTHIVSTSVPFVLVRATMLVVQLFIYTYWILQLL